MILYNLDRIFVLSLHTSIKRQLLFKKNFPELVNLNIFEWFLVDKDLENTERGCYSSHQKILKLAKERKYNTILIIEDDVKPLVSWKNFVNSVNNIKRPKNWKAIQLGYIPIKTTRTTDSNLFAINCNYFTEAYLANVNLLEIPNYTDKQIDCFLFCNGHSHLDIIVNPFLTNAISKDTYAYNPRLFQQVFDDSDIGHDNKIIVFFYNFYGSICDITVLSSYINLLSLSFLIVFSLILTIILTITYCSSKTSIAKFFIIVIIAVISIVLFICYQNSQRIIILEY